MGLVPLKFYGSQNYLMQEMARGMDDGVQHFVCLKARQLGISTFWLALDLFWATLFSGTQAAIVCDKEKTRDQFKNILTQYINALPRQWRRNPVMHNRNQIVLPNRSRVSYLIAGGRQSGSLARGEGLNFMHATEVSSWTDPEGAVSLASALAETYEKRLYIYESTARGFNLFHEMWADARRSHTQRAIFVGWWRKEVNRLSRTSGAYRRYNEPLTGKYRRWEADLKALYRVTLEPEQWAWWRWKLEEHFHGDEQAMLAEFPHHEEVAFVMTGDQFFPIAALDAARTATKDSNPKRYEYVLGARFEDTRLEEFEDGALAIWAEPEPGAHYIVAADPAYGESENSDCFSVSVLRAWTDKVEQVAEFNTPNCTLYGFAWVLAHLCGAYSTREVPATLILELSGPGRGVLQELQRMPQQYARELSGVGARQKAAFQSVLENIQHYLYKRPDTFSGSRLLQWETTWKTKTMMMHLLRDSFARGMVTVRSPDFVEEAAHVTQRGSKIEAAWGKDDRVVAMALGCVAYFDQVQMQLLNAGEPTQQQAANREQWTVAGFIARTLAEAEERKQDALWN